MSTIRQQDFIQSIADSLQFISYYHPVDYIEAMGAAYHAEESPAAKDAIAQILTNSRMCAEGHRPICQDTGIVVVFLKIGMDVKWDGVTMSVADMVNEGVRLAYMNPDNRLRASIVADPAGARKNTRDNTPAVIHFDVVPGDTVDVTVAAKGGGSENKAKFATLNPSDSIVDWVLQTVPAMGAGWCPPGMLGHRHRRQRGKGDAAGEGIADGAHRHACAHQARAGQPDRGVAHRALRQGECAGHRGARVGRPRDGARREDSRLSDTCDVAADRHHSQLRRHAPRALHARRLGCREARATRSGPLAGCAVDAFADCEARRSRHADARRGRDVASGRPVASERQDADRSRRRAQTHRRITPRAASRCPTASISRIASSITPDRSIRCATKSWVRPDRRRPRAWTSSRT